MGCNGTTDKVSNHLPQTRGMQPKQSSLLLGTEYKGASFKTSLGMTPNDTGQGPRHRRGRQRCTKPVLRNPTGAVRQHSTLLKPHLASYNAPKLRIMSRFSTWRRVKPGSLPQLFRQSFRCRPRGRDICSATRENEDCSSPSNPIRSTRL